MQILLKREVIVKACQKLHKVDLLFKHLKNSNPYYGNYYLLTLVVCIYVPLLHLFYIAYHYKKNRNFYETVIKFFNERIQQEINLLITFHYLFYISVLHQRFVFINKQLVDLNKKRKTNETLFVLRTVTKMHENLCKGAKYFNDVFSLTLFLIIVCEMPELFLLMYMVYRGSDWGVIKFKAVGYALQIFNILGPTRRTLIEVRIFVFYFE